MKRLLCFALMFTLLLALCSCSKQSESIRSPVTFYYRAQDIQFGTENDVISAELRDSFGHTEDYEYLMKQYLDGPRTENCISPFPAGTTLVQIDLVKDKILIVLSSHLSTLTGSELTIACTCLAKTLLEMTGMKAVQISSDNSLLDGEPSVKLKPDSFLLEDNYTVATTED